MGKLLRVLVVLLLLLGVAALALGILLFQKRETLKGHTQDLASQVFRLSETIEAEQVDDLTVTDLPKMNSRITVGQLLTYKLAPDALIVDTNQPAIMADAMNLLYGRSAIQLNRLRDTRLALAQKIQELDAATNKIAVLEADIARLQDEKQQLEARVAALTREVAEKNAKIDSLNAELEGARNTIADQKDEIDRLKDTLLDKDDEIKSLTETVRKQKADLDAYRGVEGGGRVMGDVKHGTKGTIVLVNSEWNFAIVAVNQQSPVAVGLELMVQRDEKLVGKIKVSDLNDQYRLAICDILLDWKQDDPEVGDYVFY